jgi:excisionase family DNA binding protein
MKPGELLTVDQAADALQMHPDTVRRMLREKRLPGVKLGLREWRVPAEALRRFISGENPTDEVRP